MSSRLRDPHAYFNALQADPGVTCQTLEGTGCTGAFSRISAQQATKTPHPPKSGFGSFGPS